MIQKIVGNGDPKFGQVPYRDEENMALYADISKANKLLKWSPKINIETGIKLLINEINYWKKAPIWTKSKISKATKDWFKYLK